MKGEFSPAAAKLDLVLLDGKAMLLDRAEVFATFTNSGIPQEIIFQFNKLGSKPGTDLFSV